MEGKRKRGVEWKKREKGGKSGIEAKRKNRCRGLRGERGRLGVHFGHYFCILGLDLMDMADIFMQHEQTDFSRKSYHLRNMILQFQESFSVIEKCPQPVIAAVHSACIGGGVDMIGACDIRWCTTDAWFQIKVLILS